MLEVDGWVCEYMARLFYFSLKIKIKAFYMTFARFFLMKIRVTGQFLKDTLCF